MAAERTEINAIIDRHLTKFDKPGVLSIRPGFKVTKNWLTETPSIVVTVHQKVASPPRGSALPKRVEGVPVDVRQASKTKREEIEDPHVYSSKLRLTPDTGAVPHFHDERTPRGGRPALAASAHAQLAAIPKPHLEYSGPAGITLEPAEVDATIWLSASPDSGWKTLKTFLSATGKSLTVGLYDFTSSHIEQTVAQAIAGKQLKLVLDHPPKNPTADQTDAQTVAELDQQLGSKFEQAWALTRTDTKATAWIYPTSYHIKVAVQDSSAFWLSSGNWNNSNQPAISPSASATDAQEARHRDRDWHVVIDNRQLAEVFEQYILNDLAEAAAHNNPPGPPEAPLTPPTLGGSPTKPFKQFFPAQKISGKFRITPLLTPDPGVYTKAIKQLIDGAEQTLYMQFQYIELPRVIDATSQPFVDLVEAVIARQRAGIDVRIIMSEFEKFGYLEQLQGLGLDVVGGVRIQGNVHNKGIVVDAKRVLVSSQNWSTDGTLYNRDAGVIIDSEKAARYFQQIFLHDWQNLATKSALSD